MQSGQVHNTVVVRVVVVVDTGRQEKGIDPEEEGIVPEEEGIDLEEEEGIDL